MEPNVVSTEQLRSWIRRLDERPGVYLIENTVTGAKYVGCARKSIRQRLQNTLSELIGGRYHVPQLQDDWQQLGVQNFVFWLSYAATKADALAEERRIAIAANAFEDFGGYCRRTKTDCVSASFRERERKLYKARKRRYEYLPDTKVDDRISPVLLRTFSRGDENTEIACLNPAPPSAIEQWKMVAICSAT